jgi:hypothetical protein
MDTIGGSMSGYSRTARFSAEASPISTRNIDSTAANTGRRTEISEIFMA